MFGIRWTSVIALVFLITSESATAELIVNWFDVFGRGNDSAAGDRDEVHGIAVDRSGNVFITGRDANGIFRGRDAFIRSYTPTGTLRWSAIEANRIGVGIALDTAGNPVVAATTNTTTKGFLSKYSSSGVKQWDTGSSGFTNGIVTGVAVNPVTGQIGASGTIPTSEGPFNAFPARDAALYGFDADGNRQFVYLTGRRDRQSEIANDVAMHASGDFVIAGQWLGGWGGEESSAQALAERVTDTGMIRHRDPPPGVPPGQVQTIWGSPFYDTATDVFGSVSGDILAAGYTHGSLAGPFQGGSSDAFLTRLDANGFIQWSRQWDAGVSFQVAEDHLGRTLLLLSDGTIRVLTPSGDEVDTLQLNGLFTSFGLNVGITNFALFGDRLLLGGFHRDSGGNADAFVAGLTLRSSAVPEPSVLVACLMGCAGLLAVRCRTRKRTGPHVA